MRSYTPGKLSLKYIDELRKLQVNFLHSITASDETSRKAREAWPYDGKRPVTTNGQ